MRYETALFLQKYCGTLTQALRGLLVISGLLVLTAVTLVRLTEGDLSGTCPLVHPTYIFWPVVH